MKKLVLLLITCLFLFGCSENDEGYQEAYEKALTDIAAMNKKIDDIANYNVYAWSRVGASDIAYFLYMSATATSSNDVGTGSDWKVDYPLMDKVFDTNVQHARGIVAQKDEITNNVIPYFLAYQEYFTTANKKDAEIQTAIKEMKEKYGKNHSDALEALSQYYLESSAYFNYVRDVGGKSLVNYQAEISSYQQSIVSKKIC